MSRDSIRERIKKRHSGEYPESCALPGCRERQALLMVADAAALFLDHEVEWDDRGNPYYVYTGIDADAAIRLRDALAALEATS